MCNQSRNITEADVFKEFERQGNSVKEYAKNETTIPCNKEWLRTIYRLLNKERLSSFVEVTNTLEITKALLEYADGNFEYETENDMLYPTTENMRRVIQSSYAKRIKRSMTNQRNARGSQKGTKDVSQEYDPEPEDDDTTDGEWTENAAIASNRKQSQATADYNRNIEKETIEKESIEKESKEKESKERKKNKPTTTNNSSSGKFSLSVSKTIEAVSYYHAGSYKFACDILVNNSGGHNLTEEETLALALYFVTDKSQSSISRITGLMDEVVRKGVRKERDILSEVSRMATQASGNRYDFDDKEKCRIMTGSIVNYLKELLERQSNPAAFPVVRASIPSKQPSLATPQETPAEQSPKDNSRQMAQINPAFLRGETDVPF